jgi:hypothetical protein
MEQASHLLLNYQFNIVMGAVEELFHERFTCMRERAMADIVEEGCRGDQRALLIGESEPPAGDIGKEHGTQRVLEPRVIGTRIDKVRKTELLDVAEALQGRGIQQGKRKLLHFNIAMDRVLDYFQVH